VSVAAPAGFSPLPYRPVSEDQGLLLASGARPAPGPSEGRTHPWVLRAARVFDPEDPAVVADYLATARPFVELRVCAGLAGAVDWEGLSALLERLRALAPEGVLRLELWYGDGEPNAPSARVLDRLRSVRPVFVHACVRGETDVSPAVRAAWIRLLDGGVPVAAEILLRRGSADTVDVLRRLCLNLQESRVRPYVLVDAAWLPDAERIPEAAISDLVRGLRGWISGLAVPQWVMENAAGGRTVRVPAYLTRLDAAGAELVGYEGRRHRYPNPPEE
jgi:lysine 2,3-aminomutase